MQMHPRLSKAESQKAFGQMDHELLTTDIVCSGFANFETPHSQYKTPLAALHERISSASTSTSASFQQYIRSTPLSLQSLAQNNLLTDHSSFP